jgi:hypothetical protein
MNDPHEREHAFAERLSAARDRATAPLPLKRDVAAFVDTLLGLLFPQLSDEGDATADEIQARLSLVRRDRRPSELEVPARRGAALASSRRARPL